MVLADPKMHHLSCEGYSGIDGEALSRIPNLDLDIFGKMQTVCFHLQSPSGAYGGREVACMEIELARTFRFKPGAVLYLSHLRAMLGCCVHEQ